ncbi:MAG: RNA polymerase sigma factor, partial [Verrucomicrobiales bacterium]
MQPSSEDDTQLIAKVRRGDREAYRFLVEAHQDRVYRVCLHTLSDRTQAEDLAQDTFTRAYQKLDQFDAAKGTFLVWILTIARRISINALKKRTPLTLNHVPETISASKDRPDAHASRSDTLAALDDALRKLSDDHRRAFVLA